MSTPKQAVTTCGIYLYNTLQQKFLICHATNSSWKFWSIPKGLKEHNEDCYAAAKRELKEETGIDADDLHLIKTYPLEKVKYQKQNKFLESFLLITDSDLSAHKFECSTYINNEFPEVDKWKWVEPEKINELLHESQRKNYERIIELISTVN
jgi:8-oxo-dGTP pyrophosphatase MutT (NUDIX family)